MGNDVFCVDKDTKKIEELSKGVVPIYEPQLEQMIHNNAAQGRLHFTTNLAEALTTCEVVFITVGTPLSENGDADMNYVVSAAKEIGQTIQNPITVVLKSTVPVGSNHLVCAIIQQELDARKIDVALDVVSNPEFLREGNAVDDCLKPERVIIGSDNVNAIRLLKELYAPFVINSGRYLVMDAASAEMTKYAANSMLALRISFMNEIANICERVGADVNQVRMGIGSDSRIGYQYIYPGCGYGGSCFPKDVNALISLAKEKDYQATLLMAVDAVNQKQKSILVEKVVDRFGEELAGYRFALWGLAFKPGTDDMRDAASISVINGLTSHGAKIIAYDPKANASAKNIWLAGNPMITYVESKYEALLDADAMILVTEWKEFRSPDFVEMARLMKQKIIFDGRNQFEAERLQRYGFEYYAIGVSHSVLRSCK
jgi:UDPglucose 6-dehydrogenase